METLRAAIDRYAEAATKWAARAGSDGDELARRRILAKSHGQRVLRRLRSELHSVHASFDRAAATAPDIYLAAPAHELWQSVAAVLAELMRGNPAPADVDRLRATISTLESELGERLA